jgi:hypothetical protein
MRYRCVLAVLCTHQQSLEGKGKAIDLLVVARSRENSGLIVLVPACALKQGFSVRVALGSSLSVW